MKLVLASASPRRADLLRAAGFSFEILPVEIDERFGAEESPQIGVARVAEAKATEAAAKRPDAVVLGADTIVVVGGQTLGKPKNAQDAQRMLRLLSGQTHEVLTGICICAPVRRLVHVETSRVRMAVLSEAEIDWYVASGEPTDKAGAYAIQGLAGRFVEAIEGSYSNVVGLPLSSVYNMLTELGCAILSKVGIVSSKSPNMNAKSLKIGLTAMVLSAAFGGLMWMSLKEDSAYYKHVEEVMVSPQQWEGKAMKLHGYVVPGSIQRRRNDSLDWKFQVESKGSVVDASYRGIVPDTFKDESEVVLEGRLTPAGFQVDPNGVMAKCPSKYEPKAGYTNPVAAQSPSN